MPILLKIPKTKRNSLFLWSYAAKHCKKTAEAIEVLQSTTKRLLQRLHSGDQMVPRNVGEARSAHACLCLVSLRCWASVSRLRVM